jgi:saccharopine dehydrogenase (NAD+, L-lysine-forming)
MKIFIRNENYNNEYRTPIIPEDVQKLKEFGIDVYIQKSDKRIFSDIEYEKYGAIIVDDDWTNISYKDHIIVGIKKLFDDLNYNTSRIHLYFAHCYKNQKNSDKLLNYFKSSSSILYDFEFFVDNKTKKRIISFGYQAGIAGCYLGIMQYVYKKINKKLVNLKTISLEELFNKISEYESYFSSDKNVKIAIIGSNGRCGSGVRYILDKYNISYSEYNKNDPINNLEKYDIVYNCINLTENIGYWYDKNTVFTINTVIVDISCDYTNIYNPIKIYDKLTLWTDPVYEYNDKVDIIAIDNLPSIIAYESSKYFSQKLVKLLKEYIDGDIHNIWKMNYDLFCQKISQI